MRPNDRGAAAPIWTEGPHLEDRVHGQVKSPAIKHRAGIRLGTIDGIGILIFDHCALTENLSAW